MKFNLKKLKEILQQNATRWMIIKDTEEWFEGFEKELLNLQRDLVLDHEYGCAEIIKEVLGE